MSIRERRGKTFRETSAGWIPRVHAKCSDLKD